jgi:AdoMet-dependent heme synthase
MVRPRRYSLAVELTPYCNQKCGYCYNDWRDDAASTPALPGADLLALIERAVTEVEFDHVTLTGGEPFARVELFDILGLLERHGLRALIISNGGLITDAHAARLAPYRPLFVQITLNGPEAGLHEEHVGKGHFDATIRGIEALVRRGVPVSGCIVITRKNARVVDRILDRFAGLGVTSVALSRYSPAGYAAEQIAELLPSRTDLKIALELAEAHGRDRGMSLQATMPIPPCVIDTSEYPHVTFSSCPIGTEMQEFALGPRGELRHCTLHTEAIGAPGDSFADRVTAPAVTRYRDVTPAFCAPCPMKAQCAGGCGAAAAAVIGDPRGLDPFVGQHVDDALRAKLAAARAGTSALIPAGRLRAGARNPDASRLS